MPNPSLGIFKAWLRLIRATVAATFLISKLDVSCWSDPVLFPLAEDVSHKLGDLLVFSRETGLLSVIVDCHSIIIVIHRIRVSS